MSVTGLLLAAGAGRRMGMPKALVADEGGPWLTRSVGVLLDGGCPRVVVVLGAEAEQAEELLAGLPDVEAVRCGTWRAGMGASLATGLRAVAESEATGMLVHLVDLPDVTAEVVARVLALHDGPTALARASYDGTPGHPVLLGRHHWSGVRDASTGDRGARLYLEVNDPVLVECGDLATGADVDSGPTGGQRLDQ